MPCHLNRSQRRPPAGRSQGAGDGKGAAWTFEEGTAIEGEAVANYGDLLVGNPAREIDWRFPCCLYRGNMGLVGGIRGQLDTSWRFDSLGGLGSLFGGCQPTEETDSSISTKIFALLGIC